MLGIWNKYFKLIKTAIDGKTITYYEYMRKGDVRLPNDLPMPPTASFYRLFNNCKRLRDITALAKWNTSNVEDMRYMFYRCTQLQNIAPLAKWDVSHVKNVGNMFGRCTQLQNIAPLAKWDIYDVEDVNDMLPRSINVGLSYNAFLATAHCKKHLNTTAQKTALNDCVIREPIKEPIKEPINATKQNTFLIDLPSDWQIIDIPQWNP